jgi:hypothetical protein
VLLTAAARRARGRRLGEARGWVPPLGAGCALACVAAVAFGRTARENARSAKAFARDVAPLIRPPASALVPTLPAEAAFYLPLDLRYDPHAAEQFTVAEPPRRGAFDLAKLRTEVPHGQVVTKAAVAVPGQPPDARWRLVRVTVRPAAPSAR